MKSQNFRSKIKLKIGRHAIYISLICLLTIVIFCKLARTKDWSTYQHDNRRSGVTSEQLKLPLHKQWKYTSRHKPQQAWQPPAKQDFWHRIDKLRARAKYDSAFHVVAVRDAVYFSSSADDKIYCLDASSGKERWYFFTEGPVRFAPTVWNGRVYVGSDDGYVYCLKAKNGELIWKYKASPINRKIPGNGRMISVWPVRTGIVVEDGIVYFAAGLFPKESVYLCALDAINGTEIWKETSTISPQGYLLSSARRLYVPTGRTSPAVFNRKDGKLLGGLSCPRAEGGTYALLTKDTLISGHDTKLRAFNTKSRDRIATYPGRQMIITDQVSYLLSDNELSAVDRSMYSKVKKQRAAIAEKHRKLASELSKMREKRKELNDEKLNELHKRIDEIAKKMTSLDKQLKDLENAEYKWRRTFNDKYYKMIVAGDLFDEGHAANLFVGGKNKIIAFRASDGKQLWNSKVSGKVYSLAVANGHLFVSTDRGIIYCFGVRPVSSPRNVSPSKDATPYPEDDSTEIYASAAARIVKAADIKKGYCLVLGCGEGRLAYEIAKRTDLRIIGIEEDADAVAIARKALDEAGLYGEQVVVHHGSLKELPYTDYFANLIVSDQTLISGKFPGSISEIFRVLRPYGGVIGQPEMVSNMEEELSRSELEKWHRQCSRPIWKNVGKEEQWAIIKRGPLPGSGEWTHQYAGSGNSACSSDQLVRDAMQVQWFGEPGPRPMVDRHHRAFAPLWKNGRLFVPAAGENRVIAVDAYNGTILWDVEVPNYRRVVVNRDAGNMVVTDDYLYVATEDSCWGLDVATGEHKLTLKVPQLVSEQWGYIASADNLLFGSGQKKNASRTKLALATVYETYFDYRPVVTSDYLFCLNRHTGEKLWHYKNGVIINSAIAVGEEHIYFVESRNPAAITDSDGKVKLEILTASGYGYLVALDKQTGRKVWEKQVDLPFEHVMHLSYANNTVLVLGTKNEAGHPRYDFYAFDANHGNLKWRNHYIRTDQGINGDHGEQDQHPVIVENSIYLYGSYSYDLQTGEKGTYKLNRGGHGCGTISGSMSYLFGRGGNPRMYKITEVEHEETGEPLDYVNRPGCWINIIPAGGLVLIPEFSSGCTCSYPIQTSIAFVPKSSVGQKD